ncbi:MAG: alpha/beta fold hydrolase [Thermoanaerobaculia bacterium]|nr:alpha/beta fold hydrolase [Thermoanaerobaculia bacterium]
MTKRRGCLRWGLAVYLLLLAASHLVRGLTPEPPPPADLERVEVRVASGGRLGERRLPLYFRRWEPEGAGEATPVMLLLHGSPGSSSDFATLGPALGRRLRVVAPDLPGFGASTAPVPSYSVRAHALYARQLLDHLGVERVHLLGFSMGGGVAIEIADREPERVASLVLLSAIGVQELELLGRYSLNHAVHGAQLATLWLAHEAVPHFGWLDGALLSRAYARNFFDTDQRPLRPALARLSAPTLLLHGERDILVPVAAAREHHRLVPQSELVSLDANHFVVFGGGERLAPPVLDFVDRVEAGVARRRENADPERLAAAEQPFDPASVPPATALALVVLMALLALSTLLSEDLTCVAAGLLVASGRIHFWPAALACCAGILVGDLAIFWTGRLLGRRVLHRRPLRWLIKPDQVQRSSAWFRRRGPVVIILSRFLPGTRVGTYFAAGLLHTSFWRFLAYFGAAVVIWTPALVWIARMVGAPAFRTLREFQVWALPGFLLLAVAIWGLVELAEALATPRGRRRLAGWWKRKREWEFWSPWVFYPPLVVYYLLLALRHRSLTLFTAANPALPGGGFLGESKSAILDRLPADAVAPYRLLPAEGDRAAELAAFLAERDGRLPVVLKPDVGQRGAGVHVVRTLEKAHEVLESCDADLLVQEYVAGAEFGVFYVRPPERESGTVFSITRKLLPEVTGDGRRTLEELILADPRAVALARSYLAGLGDRALRVPAPGERVRITELGTHCRGAIFLDGSHLATPALARRLDEISRPFEGFHFGRYDLRAPSEEALTEGRGLVVLELNGVSSEATHIYDPKHSLIHAYRVLFRQWRLAFEIGRANRARGAEPERFWPMLATLWGRRLDGG